MKQKRWQEKHRQFMFGLSPDDNDRAEGNGDPENDTFLGPQLRISDRPLSRPPSILSLQSRRRTDTPGGTSSRKDDIDRRESELGLSQFLTSKILKEKKAAAARDDDTPSVSDSDAGSVEGSYDIMARETSPPGSQSFDFLAQPPPVRDRAFSVPVIVTPARLLAEASRDDIDEEEEEDKEEYSTRL